MGKPKNRSKELGIKSEIPSKVKPMLCTLLKEPFENPKYLFEVKWDGYRIIAFKNKKVVKLKSRGDLDYPKKYPAVASSLKNVNMRVCSIKVIVYQVRLVPKAYLVHVGCGDSVQLLLI